MRVCTIPGCANLVAKGGRCDVHRREAERKRGSPTSKGYGSRWRRASKRNLIANPFCVDCGGLAEHTDHLDGLGPNGPRGYDPTNWASRCLSCHAKRTAQEQPGGWNAR